MVHSGSVGAIASTAPMEVGLVVLIVLGLGFLLVLHIRSSSRQRLDEENTVYFDAGAGHAYSGGHDHAPPTSSRRMANSARVSDRTPMAPTFSAHPRSSRNRLRHTTSVPVAPPAQPRTRSPMMVPSLRTDVPPPLHAHLPLPPTARVAVPSVGSPSPPAHSASDAPASAADTRTQLTPAVLIPRSTRGAASRTATAPTWPRRRPPRHSRSRRRPGRNRGMRPPPRIRPGHPSPRSRPAPSCGRWRGAPGTAC